MSSVPPYLLHVNSRPSKVSDDLWTQWYIEEHLPDLVSSKTSNRATFYKELPPLFDGASDSQRNFLALYQTDFQECLKTENYANLRKTSELFTKEGSSNKIGENGDFDARNYELIQAYDPKNSGNDTPPPQLLTVYMHPLDPIDFDKWYREEHLPLMSKVPGFIRALRYKLGPKTPLTRDEDPPAYLAVYEVEDVKSFFGHEMTLEAGATEWAKRHVAETPPRVSQQRAQNRMHPHPYNTRSKASSAQRESNIDEPHQLAPSVTTVAVGTSTRSRTPAKKRRSVKQRDAQQVAAPELLQTNTAISASTESRIATEVSLLFTLPAELQTLVYEYAVVENEPVHLHSFVANIQGKTHLWRMTYRVNGQFTSRPAILAVCRYLRSFVTPIFFSENTFSVSATSQYQVGGLAAMPRMLGEYARHIRSFECLVKIGIKYRDWTYVNPGVTKSDSVFITIKMKLLPGGTLVLHRCSYGTHEMGNLPEGEMCVCDLYRAAAVMVHEGKDFRRFFEMTRYCASIHRGGVWVKTCTRCNRPSLGDLTAQHED
ncbi:hypothetical protein PRZ48_008238 [Zasmidium cellare]|uniref:EthD domain-containing protein n=1 Tax=Zasmidium cellare TaxID=395010 RepID=A0ABR0EEZ2_ZASCE|nr:hypothetical protein PRZ48_008238 [Zasmidium cellare]